MTDRHHHILNQTERRKTLTALFSSAFIIGVAFGGLAPLLAIVMESKGISTLMIGLNSSMSPIGVITATTLTPMIIKRIGPVNGLLLGSGVILIAIMLFPIFDQLSTWFVLRFFMGLGLALPWVVSETWINMATPSSSRGRVMAIYTMVLAMGFAAGPVVVSSIGSKGTTPYLIYAVLVGLSTIPVFWVRHLAPKMDVPAHTKLSGLAAAAPTVFAAAMISGLTDAATFSFLPLYGLRLGFEEGYAVTLLSLFLAGNLLLQYPIGWLADHVSRRGMLLACGAACAIGPALVPIIYPSPYALAFVLFMWGGGAWAIYGVALTMLGDRFPAGQLTAANAAFIMAFEMANIIGPPVSGYAINLFAPHGLMFLLSAVGTLFFVLTAGRGIIRRLGGKARPS
jgi:MFS family permease